MAKYTWTIRGKLAVEHQLVELVEKFRGESFLKNVEVKVMAREKLMGVWGPWNSWGTDRTNSRGEFTISKSKDGSKRQFRVKVKFQDDTLEVRHETATSAAISSGTKVKWYTILEESQERQPGTFDMGKRTFRRGGRDALGDFEARRHADIWTLYQMAHEHLASFGSAYAFPAKIKVKHPHNGITGDAQEASYWNPTTKVGYIVRNSRRDDFNTDTLLHELAHFYAYTHMSGEFCLTETLLATGTTHGLVTDSCVAFGEGFAEWWKDKMMEALFGESPRLPYSRAYLVGSLGLTNQSLVQRHDEGWRSVLHLLTTADLHVYDVGTASSGSTYVMRNRSTASSGIVMMPITNCESPSIGFKQVLKIFQANPERGYGRDLARNETSIAAFLDRAEALLNKMTPKFRDLFLALSDPQSEVQPSDRLCTQTNPIDRKMHDKLISVPVSPVVLP